MSRSVPGPHPTHRLLLPIVHSPRSDLLLLCGLLTLLLPLAAGCEGADRRPLASSELVGDSTCLGCHSGFDAYLSTAHKLTSAPATAQTIHGSFAEGDNVLATANPYLHYRLEERETGFYQVAVQGPDSSTRLAERFDLVVGSGRKGQTYLYWEGDRLYQLPVSYWTGIGWANSPGYRDGVVNFVRPVPPRCLECHATYAETTPELGGLNQYDTASVVLGISCESCHGPGRQHVEAEAEGDRWLRSSLITNPADLPRERRVDGCALCHGGIGESVRPPFTYLQDEPLSGYLHQPTPPPDAPVDVHGNQVALLARSPCFQESQMTCSTCHDIHQPQRDAAQFSSVCAGCHTPGREIPEGHGSSAPGNCVDCHMPELPTNVIVGDGAGGTLRPRVRTHWIRVYGEETAGGAAGLVRAVAEASGGRNPEDHPPSSSRRPTGSSWGMQGTRPPR